MPMDLSPEQHALAQELLAEGLSWTAIDCRLGVSKGRTRYVLDPLYREMRKARGQEKYQQWLLRNGGGLHKRARRITRNSAGQCILGRPPDHVIAERDAAYGADRQLTAALCGDPLPGRSALDRRRA